METKLIRFVEEKDIESILNIYKPYIENTSITFECEVPSLENFKSRVNKISSFYPYLVCEVDNKVIGYAYAGKIREREAYKWNAELSIYLDNKYVSLGIGKILYMALIDILKLQNIYNIYGVITLPNDKSVKLHNNLGFRTLGVFKNTGYKADAWHDVIWFEKNIKPYDDPPNTLKAIDQVATPDIELVLSKYNQKLNS